jgi:RNA polymerase sigma-70 factor (ECF subfamily)
MFISFSIANLSGETSGCSIRLHFFLLVLLWQGEKKTQPSSSAAGRTVRGTTGVSANEDQADVERVLSGDVSAFSGIVLRWQRPLINLAFRFCGDRSRAEDMAQEAFLRAYRGLAKWRKEAMFSTWLFALATNLYRSELRRIPHRAKSLEELAETQGWHSDDSRFETDDRDRVVRNAVNALPPKYRDVLTLYYFHDMNVTAAAQSLALPEGTVKARLSRGRTILRSKLVHLLAVAELEEAQ